MEQMFPQVNYEPEQFNYLCFKIFFPTMPLIELLPRAMPSRNLTTQLAVQETVPIMPRCEKLHQSLIEIRSSPHYHPHHMVISSLPLPSCPPSTLQSQPHMSYICDLPSLDIVRA